MKKSLVPDTLFTSILKEQQKNLFIKSYHETMLKSFSSSGRLAKQLEEAFYEAYISNVRVYRLAEFSLEITGYFGRAKDKVSFEFSFAYDPKKVALTLTSLKATMNDEFEIVYPIKTHPSRGLLPAENVYQELLKAQKLALLETIEQKPSKKQRLGTRPK